MDDNLQKLKELKALKAEAQSEAGHAQPNSIPRLDMAKHLFRRNSKEVPPQRSTSASTGGTTDTPSIPDLSAPSTEVSNPFV